MAEIAPFGSWRSPISAEDVAAGAVTLSQVQVEGDEVYWVELRPKEQGRNVIVRRSARGHLDDGTPQGFNARNMVQEYGGGDYVLAGGAVYFANFADQRLYRQQSGRDPEPVTPEGKVRFGDLLVDAGRNRIICVREDHTRSDQDCTNELVAVPFDGGPAAVLATGRACYGS